MYKTTALLVLASASPRRRELLGRLGLEFKVRPGNGEDGSAIAGQPAAVAREWARRKAIGVAGSPRAPRDAWYLGVDTIVVIGDEVLGKPGSRNEARKFLGKLAGNWHTVVSGYCLHHPATGRTMVRAVRSRVKIKALTRAEVEAYIATDEPYDKAGAYAVQGIGAFMVEAIAGSYTNVMGLPLTEVVDDLKRLGVIEVIREGDRGERNRQPGPRKRSD
ncbi:MAG TPA: nucleoside triphosphate pyrophosphatase [bacterium]|nr:nucleoside triphosphate pyrophosphatase [bacterium]